MDSPFSTLEEELLERSSSGLLRSRRLIGSPQGPHLQVEGRDMLSFSSNDYLGLANHPVLISAMHQSVDEAGVGSGASHLITGHHRLHHSLEQALATFVRLPGALLFSSGYMANLGVIPSLLGRNDAIFADRLNHASLNDAAVLSRAKMHRYPHNDMPTLEKLLASSNARRKLVVADAVFSMDGDLAPVPQLLQLCERFDAWLMLDDAHGFGVLGQRGRGILEYFGIQSPRIIYMATLGKAAGVFGAFVAGDAVLIEYLLQYARTYTYTTAMPPALAGTVMASLQVMENESVRRTHLVDLIDHLRCMLKLRRWKLVVSDTAIQPVIVGGNDETVKAGRYLFDHGILVPAIRPPTVPNDSARLRISLTSSHTIQDIDRLAEVLASAEMSVA